MDLHEKLFYIRKEISQKKHPMEFDPLLKARNCYAYALGSEFRDSLTNGDDWIFNLGTMGGIIGFPRTLEEAKVAFLKDMAAIGINCRQSYCDEKLKKEEWRVMLFYDTYFRDDFHIIRQDIDECWSHKKGIVGEIARIDGYPEEASKYDLVGCFALKVIRE